MTKIYLVRHGETEENKLNILQGQTQGQLTSKGQTQAEELKERFKNVYFDAFVSSDLKRAFDTCSVIAEPHDLPVVTTPLLRERDWGEMTGQPVPDTFDREWPATVETEEQMMQRAKRFISYIAGHYPGKVVLAVGHGLVNRAVQAACYGTSVNEIAKMNNGEFRILELK